VRAGKTALFHFINEVGAVRRILTVVAIIASLLSRSVHFANAGETVKLSLVDAVKTAVEKNLDLRAERYNPAMQEAEYRKSKGIYNPTLTLAANYNEINSYSDSRSSQRSGRRICSLMPGSAS